MVGQASRLDVCVQNVFFLGGTAVLLFVFQLTDQTKPTQIIEESLKSTGSYHIYKVPSQQQLS